MFPAIGTEKRSVGKPQHVHNLLDGLVRVFQEVADVDGHIFVYPLECRPSTHLLAHGGQVLGRDIQLFRIP